MPSGRAAPAILGAAGSTRLNYTRCLAKLGSAVAVLSRGLSSGRWLGCRGGRDGRRAGAWGAVPVLLGVAETLADGDGLEAAREEGVEHVARQIVHGLVDGVVLDLQPLGRLGVLANDGIVPDVLGNLDLAAIVMQVALGIEVEVGNMISKVAEPAVCRAVAGGIRRAHVGWEVAQDIGQRNFVKEHLVTELLLGESRESLMRPGVAGDLVAFVDHALDEGSPRQFWVVDGAFAQVTACYEEGGLCISGLKGESKSLFQCDLYMESYCLEGECGE